MLISHVIVIIGLSSCLSACSRETAEAEKIDRPSENLAASENITAENSRNPQDAVATLDVSEGLQATLFAAEPMLVNPSNIDIDHLGRVWVCEAVNYRPVRNKREPREAGDRILILEDANGDGHADQRTVFYQSRDIDSAHGICVLPDPTGKGTKAIVSAGANVFVLSDTDGDDEADQREVLFTNIEGVQHDHGVHAFVFGPDGKLYFNMGNQSVRVKDKHGQPIVDMARNTVETNRQPYQEGLMFRCNMDGSDFETLGWNFRNNWEVCVDSFGTLWQSDNDDDGNRSVRINYLMEFGNYGFKDEITGAAWPTQRTGQAEDIPTRHWHQNDPGVIPNLLITGQGGPTGICVYEGNLLPKVFHNQLIHCDSVPNVVRCYPATPAGAGYTARSLEVVFGARDNWFRPTDVCVAPDGSLMISDWYDPGVGGHSMGDPQRGRIFRVAPIAHPYSVPQFDLKKVEGAIRALASCNSAVRYMAWTALHRAGVSAEAKLLEAFKRLEEPRQRARVLWLLGKLDGRGSQYVTMAIIDGDPDIRIVGLRLARQLNHDLIPVVEHLVNDESVAVLRECAIALRGSTSANAPQLWARLAKQHDGKDRWYLEALGIGAEGQWDRYLGAWLDELDGTISSPAARDIVWRSRARVTSELLADIIRDNSISTADLPRYFRAFDFQLDNLDGTLEPLVSSSFPDVARQHLIVAESLKRIGKFEDPAKLDEALDKINDDALLVALIDRHDVAQRYSQLLPIAQSDPHGQVGVAAIRVLLAKKQGELISTAVQGSDLPAAIATVEALGNSADGSILQWLLPIVQEDGWELELRRQATRAMAKTTTGAKTLLELARSNQLGDELKAAASLPLNASPVPELRAEAARLFPLPQAKDSNLPPLDKLLEMHGDALQGQVVFANSGECSKCHKVNNEGKEIGPELTEIGSKLGRQALYESILYPSAGISHNYETYVVYLETGNVINGLLVSRDEESVTIKSEDGIARKLKRGEIEEMNKSSLSLMPADLQKTMSAEDLVNVVEYLMTLKKP